MASRAPCQADADPVEHTPLALGFASRRRWLRWALWGSAGIGSQALAATAWRNQTGAGTHSDFPATEHSAEAEAFLSLTQPWAAASAFKLQAALASGELSITRLLGVVGGRLRLLGGREGLAEATVDQVLPAQLWTRARQLQRERREQGPRSSWHGLPVLVQLDALKSADLYQRLDQAGALILPLGESTPFSTELLSLAGIPLLILSPTAPQQQALGAADQGDRFYSDHRSSALLLAGSTPRERHQLLTELGLRLGAPAGDTMTV